MSTSARRKSRIQRPRAAPTGGARKSSKRSAPNSIKAGLADEIHVTACGSLGLCERGPNMVVYPEGVWYSGVQKTNVPEIVRGHFMNNHPVERLRNKDAAALKAEILDSKRKYLAALKAAQVGQKKS